MLIFCVFGTRDPWLPNQVSAEQIPTAISLDIFALSTYLCAAVRGRAYGHAFFSALSPVRHLFHPAHTASLISFMRRWLARQNTHITKHHGPTNKKLRVHLPLIGTDGSRLRCARAASCLAGGNLVPDGCVLGSGWRTTRAISTLARRWPSTIRSSTRPGTTGPRRASPSSSTSGIPTSPTGTQHARGDGAAQSFARLSE